MIRAHGNLLFLVYFRFRELLIYLKFLSVVEKQNDEHTLSPFHNQFQYINKTQI